MSKISKKNNDIILDKVLYIYYSHHFEIDINKIYILLDFDSGINAITLAYAFKLGFKIYCTNVEA